MSLTGALPLIGVIIGAGLQYLLTQSTARKKQLLEERVKAYVEYMSAVTEKARLPADDTTSRTAALARIDSAKLRICVYGSRDVVEALARFEGAEYPIADGATRDLFIALLQSMRSEAIESGADLSTMTLHKAIHGEFRRQPTD